MDATTLLGLIIGIGGILLGNIIEGGHVASLVPPVVGLWHAGEIPVRVGAVSHTLNYG